MTPAAWFAAADAVALFAAAPPGPRRCRLFLVACLRRHVDSGGDVFRAAVDVAERFADGLADEADMESALVSLRHPPAGADWTPAAVLLCEAALGACNHGGGVGPAPDGTEFRTATTHNTLTELAEYVAGRVAASLPDYALARSFRLGIEESKHAQLFRCLTPPPGHPRACPAAWLTSNVAGLADAIYDGRAFHDCPVLADAFEDAGCDDLDLLAHLRGPGPHARGCWPVDLALARDLSG